MLQRGTEIRHQSHGGRPVMRPHMPLHQRLTASRTGLGGQAAPTRLRAAAEPRTDRWPVGADAVYRFAASREANRFVRPTARPTALRTARPGRVRGTMSLESRPTRRCREPTSRRSRGS